MNKTGWSRVSRHLRGYGTEWNKTRLRILKRDNGICQPCFKQGNLHTGNEVDHIVSRAEGKRLGWAQSRIECDANLQTICHEAHLTKTASEQGRVLKPKQTIGIDGYPI
jgi:5-methylcytosine-specific restriction protein A